MLHTSKFIWVIPFFSTYIPRFQIFLTLCMLRDYHLHIYLKLYSAIYLHFCFFLESFNKTVNSLLVSFVFRKILTFKVIIDILISVKRYSFNPLYNPYILIIYTPLNEKRSHLWPFFIFFIFPFY